MHGYSKTILLKGRFTSLRKNVDTVTKDDRCFATFFFFFFKSIKSRVYLFYEEDANASPLLRQVQSARTALRFE